MAVCFRTSGTAGLVLSLLVTSAQGNDAQVTINVPKKAATETSVASTISSSAQTNLTRLPKRSPMTNSIPDGYDYHVIAPTNHAGLTFRFLKPEEFKIADLPPETPDFAKSAAFMPLVVALTQYGPMVFSVGARPSYDDGTAEQWLAFLLREEGYQHGPITETRLGSLPAVTCDALQKTEDVVMKMRFILLEDGGRIFQLTAMAPEPIWGSVVGKFAPMFESFELRESRGTKVPLRPGQPPPAVLSEAAPQPNLAATATPSPSKASARLTLAELVELALADSTSSLDSEHPINVNLRDRGAGLVPRLISVDLPSKSARIGAGAVQGIFRVPLGWHAIDDGKRTLIFDAGGRIQVSLNQRSREGLSSGQFARGCVQPYLEQQPGLDVATLELDGIAGAGVRGAKIEGEILDQYFLVREVGPTRPYLVARVTAGREDATRALNLAGDILATFEAPAAIAGDAR